MISSSYPVAIGLALPLHHGQHHARQRREPTADDVDERF
jgi:hypothetical protein